MITREQVRTWADAYREAWETANSEAAADLFTASASYRDNIFEEPHLGREGIMRYWTDVTAAQSEVVVRMGEPFLDGNRAVVEFWTTMSVSDEPLTLPGALLLRFDPGGLCSDLREYWSALPEIRQPPAGWGT